MTKEEEERALIAYSKISEQMTKEDTLVNIRMNWGFAINGALLVILGAGVNLWKDIPRESIEANIIFFVWAICLPSVGMIVFYMTKESVNDARKQLHYIREVYEKNWQTIIEENLRLPQPYLSEKRHRQKSDIPWWWTDSFFYLVGAVWLVILLGSILVVFYPRGNIDPEKVRQILSTCAPG